VPQLRRRWLPRDAHQGLVEETEAVTAETGGRPARLMRFRREVLLEAHQPGRAPAGLGGDGLGLLDEALMGDEAAEVLLVHRRMLATALGRLRGKIKYRPVVFELMPPAFTLGQLPRPGPPRPRARGRPRTAARSAPAPAPRSSRSRPPRIAARLAAWAEAASSPEARRRRGDRIGLTFGAAGSGWNS
jgi:hypothetical protein